MQTYRFKQGFTLIELAVFIVILSIIFVGIFSAINAVLTQSHKRENLTMATQIAQQRMELILGQRRSLGFAHFQDPCQVESTANYCQLPAGYTITTPTITSEDTFKNIVVKVNGPATATLTMMVFPYENV